MLLNRFVTSSNILRILYLFLGVSYKAESFIYDKLLQDSTISSLETLKTGGNTLFSRSFDGYN